MLYLQLTYFHPATYEPSYRAHSHSGTFDFESWTCQSIRFSNEFSHKYCAAAKAGRVIEALLCFNAIFVTVLSIPVLRRERSIIYRVNLYDCMGRRA
ncbi:3a3454ae-b157-4dc9-a631-6b52f228f0a5-CDS, partial [Sclerotinia trifoliorum]